MGKHVNKILFQKLEKKVNQLEDGGSDLSREISALKAKDTESVEEDTKLEDETSTLEN